ncbi:tetratricopeptide repeat protein [Granulosicoccus sp. 3-233]|uniref:tetratricopeptide repeat protein n=1 Tax=Granulosicoccus sp. 3-233 TaxID=3417969 RepID=UPI003D358C68
MFTLASISLQSCAIPANLRHEQATGSSRDRALGHEQAQVLFAKVDQAESAYQQSQWQDAAALYQAVLKQLPDDPYLWFRLGNALTQQGQYDQAIEAFETSIRQDARQAKPWFNLSTAHLLGAQLASLKAWQAMDPGDPGRQAAQQRLDGVTRLLQ